MLSRRDHLMSIRVSVKQWDGWLGDMTKGRRAGYIRNAILAYIDDVPVLQMIPLEEPPDEPLRSHPIQVAGNDITEAWFSQVPDMMRSYLIRHILNWYRQRHPADGVKQQPLDDMAASLQRTGTDL